MLSMFFSQLSCLPNRLQHSMVQRFNIRAEQGGADHETDLHAKILRNPHHIRISRKKMADVCKIELAQPFQKIQSFRFFIIKIHQRIHIAPDIA